MGSHIDGSGPGSLFTLEQKCVLIGRPYSQEQGVLLNIVFLLGKSKTPETSRLLSDELGSC